jgi:uncharacterized LabA/DUF88 family protein
VSVSGNTIALFIDGANLYATAKTLGFDIDYKRLLNEFQSQGTLRRAFYYTAIFEDQEFSSIRALIDWLDYNGFTVVTKLTKEFIDASGHRKVKGNMKIELAVDAMELAEHIDQMVLFSGDGDFRSLVEAVQHRPAHAARLASHPGSRREFPAGRSRAAGLPGSGRSQSAHSRHAGCRNECRIRRELRWLNSEMIPYLAPDEDLT